MRRAATALFLVSVILEMLASGSAWAQGRRRSVRHPPRSAVLPVAVADGFSLDQGGVLTIAAPGVLANDTLNGGGISSYGPSTGSEQTNIGVASQTSAGGILTVAASGALTYTPQASFSGTDTFVYVLSNADGKASATVTMVVRPSIQTAAVEDSYATESESELSVPAPGVLTNDVLSGGRIVSFGKNGSEQTSLGQTTATLEGGVIRLRADGSFSYTTPPTEDDGYGYGRPFKGVDSFTYTIQSGATSSKAAVSINVGGGSTNADFTVTSPGFFFAFSGLSGENPVLTLTRGRTYKFQINTSPAHPFAILDAPAGSVTNNNIYQGLLTFEVPASAQNYRYHCSIHDFGNSINTVP